MLSPEYPKPHVVSYEETMLLSTSFLWFPIFRPSTLNFAIHHPAIAAMLCYP